MPARYGLRKVSIPEGENGAYRVEKFEISEEGAKFHNMRASFQPPRSGGARWVEPGEYTKLTHNGNCIMSDTPAELTDHIPIARKAKGRILITGLGIGVVIQACLGKQEVEKVTVLEIAEEVIQLVGPHYKERYGNRLEIIHTDAREFQPATGDHWETAWHDIWEDICGDNWKEMQRLKDHYALFCSWQGCWAERETNRAAVYA